MSELFDLAELMPRYYPHPLKKIAVSFTDDAHQLKHGIT
jgi:hypothetical protein